MMTARVIVGSWAIFLTLSGATNGVLASEVGELGDIRKIAIRGATTFTADDIREQLWRSLDVQMAAYSHSPLADFVAVLEDKVSEGYRYAGFVDVKVSSEVDQKAGRLALTVVEGRRLMAGDIHVEGAKSILVPDLVRQLTSPKPSKDANAKFPNQSKSEDPATWRKGKPAPFDRQTRNEHRTDIEDALAALGHSSAQFSAEVVPDPNGNTASLTISIRDEGPKDVLDQIEIFGNQRHSRKEILDYLDLKPGMSLNQDACRRLQERLWLSGRFIKCDATLTPVVWREEKMRLTIDLMEYENAPRLIEALSPSEEALLKCCRWLRNPACWDGDFVYRDRKQNLESVISIDRGVLWLLWKPNASGSRSVLDHAAILATGEDFQFCNVNAGKKLASPIPNRRILVNVEWTLSDQAEDWN